MKPVRYVAICVVFVGLLASLAEIAESQGGTFVLPNFPYHRQETEWYCGDASLQMVYEYTTGASIPQDAFASVARTSEAVGTLSNDIVRAMRFSHLSEPASQIPGFTWSGAGYPGYDLGFSAEGYYSYTPWVEKLKKTVNEGVPVIVLQQYWFDDSGGHYRVVYGFNDTHIFMKDPWDREQQPRDLYLTNDQFVRLWSYAESSNVGPQFFGAALVPWDLALLTTTLPSSTPMSLHVQLEFAYASPFLGWNTQFGDLSDAFALRLQLHSDPSIWSSPVNTLVVQPSRFNPLDSATGAFNVSCISTPSSCSSNPPLVRASGLITGSVPSAVRDQHTTFPGYTYIDEIGTFWTKLSP